MRDVVRVEAPAKVNLWLHVLAREECGFHTLETLFCTLALHDSLTLACGLPGVALEVEGDIPTGPPDLNLAVRAAEAFHLRLGRPPALRIQLVKRIPSSAGLGGGSSDAAATLLGLNAAFGTPFTRAELLQMGIGLGSDVPFFLGGSPLALAWGRGERLLALPPLPERPVLVAHPGVGMPTPDAFRRVAARRGGTFAPRAAAVDVADLASWESVAARAYNDFEPVVVEEIPKLRGGLDAMRSGGAEIALLGGSGSSLFGIFAKERARDAAAVALSGLGFAVWQSTTRASEAGIRVDRSVATG